MPAAAIIDLDGETPIAAGGKCDIYHHPRDRTQLIKVISARRQAKQAARGLWERLYKPTYEREYMLEIATVYRAVLRDRSSGAARLPIVMASGVVATTKGLGLACEKIAGRGGALAPTLEMLLASGEFDSRHLERLNVFVERLFALQIVPSDLTARNIVWSAADDAFVAIDGFGSRTLIPIFVWSRRANDRELGRFLKGKVAGRHGLAYDRRARRFELMTGTVRWPTPPAVVPARPLPVPWLRTARRRGPAEPS
jgi:hypothetical protein